MIKWKGGVVFRMLGIFEKRSFPGGEAVWLGRYRNLSNALHWHFECEIIRVVKGRARIRLDSTCYDAEQGDCFFCAGQTLHCILSEPGALVDVCILKDSLCAHITGAYALLSEKLPGSIPVADCFCHMRNVRAQKKPFFREVLEVCGKGLLLEIFQNCPMVKREAQPIHRHNLLLRRIHEEFAFITFDDAVRASGYSPSHFSKVFKTLTGMHFSGYLNLLKVEHAIALLRDDGSVTITAVCAKCGFSTVRNFNRVFKSITGFTPRTLPADFLLDTNLHIAKTDRFDPTHKEAELL